MLGTKVQVALGRFLTEYGLFTLWFGGEVKGSNRSMQKTMELMRGPR